jgi:hypothetical protein
MAEHIWTVLCRRAVVDRFTNSASMFDALEELNFIPAEPLPDKWSQLPIEAVLISFVIRSNVAVPERVRLKIEVVGPNGDVHEKRITGEIDLTDHLRGRTLIQLGSLPFRAFGIHKFVVYLEQEPNAWTEVAEIPLDLKLNENAPKAGSTKKPPKRKPSKKAVSKT